MKKTVVKTILSVAILTGSMLSASQSNNQGMTSIFMGASKASYNKGGTGDTKVAFGTDIMVPIKIVPNLYAGIGIDIVGIDGYVAYDETYGNYTLGGQLKIGYSLESLIHWDVNLKAGYGYGVTRYASTNNWGSQYEAGAETRVYKSLGVGYKYKHVNMGIGSASYNANIVYAEAMF